MIQRLKKIRYFIITVSRFFSSPSTGMVGNIVPFLIMEWNVELSIDFALLRYKMPTNGLIIASVFNRYFWSALGLNGAFAACRCILPHRTYVKDIGLSLQRTAGAFGFILRGATGDMVVVVGGGE